MKVLANQITAKELEKLCKKSSKEKVVSLILSSTTVSDLNKKLQVKFKNSLRDIQELIENEGVDSSLYISQLKNINIEKEISKLPRTKTLVIYATKKNFQVFNLVKTIKDTPLISFDYTRVIKYFISEVNLSSDYVILDLSLNDINIYRSNKYMIEEFKGVKLPTSIKHFYETERAGIFNMNESRKDEQDAMTKSFLLAIDKKLLESLNKENIPVMLAGADNIISLYKSISKYPNIWDCAIEGNVDNLSIAQLHTKSLTTLKKQSDLNIESTINKINEQRNLGKGSNEFSNIFEAAIAGKVGKLVLKIGYKVWGSHQDNKLNVSLRKTSSDEDLVNQLMCIVLSTGGEVYWSPSKLITDNVIAEYRY